MLLLRQKLGFSDLVLSLATAWRCCGLSGDGSCARGRAPLLCFLRERWLLRTSFEQGKMSSLSLDSLSVCLGEGEFAPYMNRGLRYRRI